MAKRPINPDEAALLAEANRVNYRLRSTFFYRKLKEYETLSLPAMIAALTPIAHFYNWDKRAAWGIAEDAFQYVDTHADLHLFQVFCHPKLLREHARLVAYYRNIAALSQKSVGYLAGVNVKRIETDTKNEVILKEEQALVLARLFNEHISLIVEASIQSLTIEEIRGLLLTSTGSQIDGSWRNAIGEEAEKLIQRLLIGETKERNILAALLTREGTGTVSYDPANFDEQLGNIHLYRGILLTNGASILFSSEPDISFLDKNGTTVCVIEVKGGADPAGALERYGAAKKSLEESRRLTPNVKTVLVASCITPEVHIRIQNDPVITSYYSLATLLTTEETTAYEEFVQDVFAPVGL